MRKTYDVEFLIDTDGNDLDIHKINAEMAALPFTATATFKNYNVLHVQCRAVEVEGLAAPLEAMRRTHAAISPIFRHVSINYHEIGGLLWQDVVAAHVTIHS